MGKWALHSVQLRSKKKKKGGRKKQEVQRCGFNLKIEFKKKKKRHDQYKKEKKNEKANANIIPIE